MDADYDEYYLSFREFGSLSGTGLMVLLLFTFVFYDSLMLGVMLFPPLLFFLAEVRAEKKKEERRQRLTSQFLTAIKLLGDYLKAGYSIENALLGSVKELTGLYGESSDIVREWQLMGAKMGLNQTAEEAFLDFGERAHQEQIHDFTEVFALVKRSGGQLAEVVSSVAEMLTEQFSVEEQIRTSVASRQLEQKIMDVMPMAILLYIRLTSAELIAVMYEGPVGRMVMTGCLAMYLGAYFWAEKILKIRV